tara:strand:- start:87 stop:323 length:237 start_codon:yes stop_codon:yes gene_type:complete
MMEAAVALIIAAVAGLGTVSNRLHSRINSLDSRVDGFELRIAENYITKSEFVNAMERVEKHMVRIEDKLDRLANCDKR